MRRYVSKSEFRFVLKLTIVSIIATILLGFLFGLGGCQIPGPDLPKQKVVNDLPNNMPDGKWVSFSWYSSNGGAMRAHLGRFETGVGIMNAHLNSKAHIHTRYMATIVIPALTQKQWQDNAKAISWWKGHFGALPPGVMP